MRRVLTIAGLLVAGAALAADGDPSFRLTNATGQQINQVHVSPSVQAAWGEDRLGSGSIKPDSTANIRVPAGPCLNDIRAVLADGSAREKRQVNTCTTKDVTSP